MPRIQCSHCDASLTLKDDGKLGKKIRCPKCGEMFVAQAQDSPGGDEEFGDFPAPAPKRTRARRPAAAPTSKTPVVQTVVKTIVVLVAVGTLITAGIIIAGKLKAPEGVPVAGGNNAAAAAPAPGTGAPGSAAAGQAAPSPRKPNPSSYDPQLNQTALAAVKALVAKIAGDDEQAAKTAIREMFVNEKECSAIFPTASPAGWECVQESQNQIIENLARVRPMFAAVAKPDSIRIMDSRILFDFHSEDDESVLAMLSESLICLSALLKDERGKSTEGLLVVFPDGRSPKLMPPLFDLAVRLRERDAFVPMQQFPMPFDPLDKAGEAYRGRAAGATRDDNGLGMKLVWCPPGDYMMGHAKGTLREWFPKRPLEIGESDPVEGMEQRVQKAVKVTHSEGFWIGRTEVTEAQWEAVMKAKPGDPLGPNHPAVFVKWAEVVEFCRRLTKDERSANRLPVGWEYAVPTEAQWEYACRAGTTTIYSFGNDPKLLDQYGWFWPGDDSTPQRAEVALKKPNPWGLHDMHGNVKEWCADWWTSRPVGGADPLGVANRRGIGLRTLRGGAVDEIPIRSISSSRVFNSSESERFLGLRVVVTRSRTGKHSAMREEFPVPNRAVARLSK